MAEIEVDTELGTVRVLKVVAAHDVGRAINPSLVEGQIEGGVAQGLGMALMEEFFPGKSETARLPHPTIGDIPPIESILIEDPSLSARSAQKYRRTSRDPNRARHPERHPPRDWSAHPPRPSHARPSPRSHRKRSQRGRFRV